MNEAPPAELSETPRWLRADWVWLGVVFGVALAARFIYLSEAQACPLSGYVIMDGKSYSEWADRIVAGDWLGSQIFYQAPLYPYLLAGMKMAVGSSLFAIKSVQMVAGGLSCVLLFLAGRLLFSRGVGAAAGLVLAMFAPAIFFDSLIQKAGLTTLLTTLFLWLLARACVRPTALRFVALGSGLALLMLTREETILLVPAIGVWVLWRFNSVSLVRRLVLAGAFGLATFVTLLPVALRNAKVGGEFTLTTSQAGPNFYIGNNPAATGVYSPLRPGRSNTAFERVDAFELAEQAEGRTLSPREVSRYWMRQAFSFITGQPVAWGKLMVRKVGYLVNSHEVPDSEDQYFFERYSPFLRTISPVSQFGVVFPLALMGMVLTLPRFRAVSGLWVFVVTVGGAVLMFYVFGRYRFPIVPPLILFAVAALPMVREQCSLKRRGLVAASLIALVAGGVASNFAGQGREREMAGAYTNAGAALAEAGHDDQAVPLLETALSISPAPEIRANLARSLFRLGKRNEAVSMMRLAASQRPTDARLRFALGTILAETGDLPGAATNLGEAVRLAPQDFDARVNHFNVLLELRMWKPAIAAIEATIAQFPRDVLLKSTLAYTLATCPDATVRNPARAVVLAEEANGAVANDNPELLDILAASYASAGRFAEAVATVTRGIAAARAMKIEDLARELESRRAMYAAGRALHEGPMPAKPPVPSGPAPPP